MSHPRPDLRLPLLLLGVFLLGVPPARAVEILGVDEIRPGMIGTGYTVMHGADVEPFQVEILGVLRHSSPGRHLILAEAHGDLLSDTGVPAGMSGSPVYIDGKLVGACAFTWSFSKRPIMGITPIEYMLDLMARDEATRAPPETSRTSRRLDLPPFDPNAVHALSAGAEPVFVEPLRRLARQGGPASEGIVPIAVPLSLSGVPASVLDPLAGLLQDLRLTPVSAGRFEEDGAPRGDTSLKPGSAVGAALVRGDLRLDAFGTVTYVAGNHVFAFGHPFFGMGPVEFPMSEGWVHTVIPRQSLSFKMISHVRDVGAIRQDREAGIYGVIGDEPDLLPFDVEIERGDGAVESHHLELVRDPVLTPLLAFVSLQAVLVSAEKEEGGATIEFLEGSRIVVRDYDPVSLENFYSGPQAAWEASGAVASYLAWILNNEWEAPHVQEVRLKLRAQDGLRTAEIQRVQFGRARVRPGDVVPVEVLIKPYRGEPYREVSQVKIPEELPDGAFVLTVGGAAEVDRLSPVPRGASLGSLGALLDLIHGMRRNSRVYLQLSRPQESLLVAGEFLPNLPPSMEAMLRSERVKGESAIYSRSELVEEEIPVPYQLDGLQRAPIEVRGD